VDLIRTVVKRTWTWPKSEP